MIHHTSKTIGALAAVTTLVVCNATAEVEYTIHTGYSSGYLFRGIDLADDLIETGLDASSEIAGFGLSGGLWAATFRNSPVGTGNDFDNEVDFYGAVSKDFGFVSAAVGYIYYWNIASLGSDAQEVYFKLSRDFGFAGAFLAYYWDVDGDNNGYTEFGLSRGFELNPCLTLNVASNIGYLIEQADFTAWTSKISLDWGFVEHAKLSPFVALSFALSDESTTAYAGSGNEFVAGSMLSVSF